MKCAGRTQAAIGASIALAILLISVVPPAQAQRIGKNASEVVELAKKEGEVRIATGWDRENIPIILKGFHQKYPMIKVNQSEVTGIASRERILNEAIAGIVEYDLVSVSGELRKQYIKAGALAGPLEWQKLTPDQIADLHISPDKYFVIGGFSTYLIIYNPKLVPADRVPKKWEDCLDPYWKGKIAIYTRPRTFTALYPGWGEEKLLSFARKLKENSPVWTGNQTGTITQVAAGEYPISCGMAYHSIKGVLQNDPKANLAYSIPPDQPFNIGESLAVMRGAKNTNAAILLGGWLASAEAQQGYEIEGRSSPFVEGTEAWHQVRKNNGKAIWGGWDALEYEPEVAKKIVAAWGFPKAKKR